MESTWENRDFPVLKAVVEICDEDDYGDAEPWKIAERTGLPGAEFQKALWKLSREMPPFFEVLDVSSMSERQIAAARHPTGHAQRIVGAWPTPESLVDRMVAALQQAAEDASTPEEKTRLRKAADAVGGVGKDVVTGVITHVLTQGF